MPLTSHPSPTAGPTQPAGCVQDERPLLYFFTSPQATGSPCLQTNAALSGIVGPVCLCLQVCVCLGGASIRMHHHEEGRCLAS